MHRTRFRSLAPLLALPALFAAAATPTAAAPADGAEDPAERRAVHLPRGDVFEPLLADPKEPRTFAAWDARSGLGESDAGESMTDQDATPDPEP